MNKLQSPLFLWIILGAIILLMVPVIIIDRVTHSGAASPVATSSNTETVEQPKVGWKIGEEAPDFLLTTTDNHDIKLSDYRGRNVIINFWASWCGPCRMEVPVFKSIGSTLSKSGVVFLAVSVRDSMDNAQSYAKSNDLDWIIPVDPRGMVADYYNVHGIPTSFFIDKKGIIKSIKIGPFLSENEITDRLSALK